MSSAVLQRSRRATAGKRIASLIGQAAEDDDAFWSHKIWSEGGGGFSRGNEDDDDAGSDASGSDDTDGERSYHASDEDSEVAVDTFDSDFDESESESEGDDAEAELLAEERAAKRAAKSGVGLSKKGRGAIRQKRVLGEGWNAGLALNWFPAGDGTLSSALTRNTSAALSIAASQSATTALSTIPTAQVPPLKRKVEAPNEQPVSTDPSALNAAPPTQLKLKFSSQQTSAQAIPSIPSIRPPSSSRKRNFRAGTLTKTITTVQQSEMSLSISKHSDTAKANQKQHKGKRHFTQEEMILEALKETEVENNKWLLGRKRSKEAVQEEIKKNAIEAGGNVVERFNSRRGGYNIISFMDMGRLPHIFTQQAQLPKTHRGSSKRKRSYSDVSRNSDTKKNSIEKCAITGKEARYKDPQTLIGYYDSEAFKELRRRNDAGLLKTKIIRKKNFRNDRTILASTSTTSDIKVMVTQNETPVSPPENEPDNLIINNVNIAMNESLNKRDPRLLPEAALSSSDAQSQFENENAVHSGESTVFTTQTAKKSETVISLNTTATLASNNGSDHTLAVFPSRKSPRTPKPSAKVLDATSSNHLLQSHRAMENKSTHSADRVAQSSSKKVDKGSNAKTLNLSEDILRASSSPREALKKAAELPRSSVDSAPDIKGSIGIGRAIESANEPGARNGNCSDTNISTKEIVA